MRKNLSQQKLMEILCSEMDILQQTSKSIKEVAPEIAKQLAELKSTKLKFDLNTGKLEKLLSKHIRDVNKKAIVPKWFMTVAAIVIVLLLTQRSFGIL